MIIIIDNYDGFVHSLYELAAQAKTDIHLFRNDKISVEALKELHPRGIVLSSGPGMPKESGICLEILNTFVTKIPILGVGLGCHIIAEYFGGQLMKTPPIHAISCFVIHRGGKLYKNIASPFVAGQYHSHVIDKRNCPPKLIIEAEKDDGTIMSIKHADYPCYGVQFYPESMLTLEGQKIVGNFCAMC